MVGANFRFTGFRTLREFEREKAAPLVVTFVVTAVSVWSVAAVLKTMSGGPPSSCGAMLV